MTLIELTQYISDEKKAEEFLRSVGILKTFTKCIHCNSTSLGNIRRNKIKCYSCKREWNKNKFSVFEKFNIPYSKFLLALKLFELELTAKSTSTELGIPYKRIKQLFIFFRTQLTGLKEKELCESSFQIQNKSSTFNISYSEDKISISIKETTANLPKFNLQRMMDHHTGVHFDICIESFDDFVKLANQDTKYSNMNNFWRYATKRIKKYHGIENRYFYLYLKELEVRYNRKTEGIWELLKSKLSVKTVGG